MSKTKKLLIGAIAALTIAVLAWTAVSSDLTDMQGRFAGRFNRSLSPLSPLSILTPLTPMADLSDGLTHPLDDEKEESSVFNPFNKSGSFSPWNK